MKRGCRCQFLFLRGRHPVEEEDVWPAGRGPWSVFVQGAFLLCFGFGGHYLDDVLVAVLCIQPEYLRSFKNTSGKFINTGYKISPIFLSLIGRLTVNCLGATN